MKIYKNLEIIYVYVLFVYIYIYIRKQNHSTIILSDINEKKSIL